MSLKIIVNPGNEKYLPIAKKKLAWILALMKKHNWKLKTHKIMVDDDTLIRLHSFQGQNIIAISNIVTTFPGLVEGGLYIFSHDARHVSGSYIGAYEMLVKHAPLTGDPLVFTSNIINIKTYGPVVAGCDCGVIAVLLNGREGVINLGKSWKAFKPPRYFSLDWGGDNSVYLDLSGEHLFFGTSYSSYNQIIIQKSPIASLANWSESTKWEPVVKLGSTTSRPINVDQSFVHPIYPGLMLEYSKSYPLVSSSENISHTSTSGGKSAIAGVYYMDFKAASAPGGIKHNSNVDFDDNLAGYEVVIDKGDSGAPDASVGIAILPDAIYGTKRLIVPEPEPIYGRRCLKVEFVVRNQASGKTTVTLKHALDFPLEVNYAALFKMRCRTDIDPIDADGAFFDLKINNCYYTSDWEEYYETIEPLNEFFEALQISKGPWGVITEKEITITARTGTAIAGSKFTAYIDLYELYGLGKVPPIFSNENIVQNGDFSSGLAGWGIEIDQAWPSIGNGSSISHKVGMTYAGKTYIGYSGNVLRIYSAATNHGGRCTISQKVPVIPGDKYYFIFGYATNGSAVIFSKIGTTNKGSELVPWSGCASSSLWVQRKQYFTVPSDVYFAFISITCVAYRANGIGIDNIHIVNRRAMRPRPELTLGIGNTVAAINISDNSDRTKWKTYLINGPGPTKFEAFSNFISFDYLDDDQFRDKFAFYNRIQAFCYDSETDTAVIVIRTRTVRMQIGNLTAAETRIYRIFDGAITSIDLALTGSKTWFKQWVFNEGLNREAWSYGYIYRIAKTESNWIFYAKIGDKEGMWTTDSLTSSLVFRYEVQTTNHVSQLVVKGLYAAISIWGTSWWLAEEAFLLITYDGGISWSKHSVGSRGGAQPLLM